tara:strand:- start:20860 stop:21192 length:333 start_codon:yes stop_codon:yes gene_type:complete
MPMSIDQLATIASLVLNLVTLAGVIYAVMTAKANSNASKLDGLTTALGTVVQRVERLETEMQHLPTKEAVHALAVMMSGIQEGFKGFQGSMDTLARRFDRIEGYMMRRDE